VTKIIDIEVKDTIPSTKITIEFNFGKIGVLAKAKYKGRELPVTFEFAGTLQ